MIKITQPDQARYKIIAKKSVFAYETVKLNRLYASGTQPFLDI